MIILPRQARNKTGKLTKTTAIRELSTDPATLKLMESIGAKTPFRFGDAI
jgi:hypothetical protein